MNSSNQQQNTPQATLSSPPPISNTQATQSTIWKSDAFVVLALVIFWPVGLFLMWKYTKWRKWVKGLLTFFFILGVLPILLIWGLLFGLKGYSLIDNTLNPRVVNQSKLYSCQPVSSEWSRCTNTKYKFSFEYPADWNYIDLKPEGIEFSPLKENLLDNEIISIGSPYEWDTEEDAKKFAKGAFTGGRQETTIDGLYAAKDAKTYSDGALILVTVIVEGKTTYQFLSHFYKLKDNKLKDKGITLANEELQTIFDHMSNSFKKER